jgi:hypothetical protein
MHGATIKKTIEFMYSCLDIIDLLVTKGYHHRSGTALCEAVSNRDCLQPRQKYTVQNYDSTV